MVKRVMGGSSFVKIQDRSGQIQLMLKRDRLGEELYSEFKKWDVGDIVAARGELIKTKTGELSVDASEPQCRTISASKATEGESGDKKTPAKKPESKKK